MYSNARNFIIRLQYAAGSMKVPLDIFERLYSSARVVPKESPHERCTYGVEGFDKVDKHKVQLFFVSLCISLGVV